MMDEKFYYYKELAEKIEDEMINEDNPAVKEQLAMQLFLAVSNMSQIIINLMPSASALSAQTNNIIRNPREIVIEEARNCDFIDLSIWKEFWMMRNLLSHSKVSVMIPMENLTQKILPEFVKEFEKLSGKF